MFKELILKHLPLYKVNFYAISRLKYKTDITYKRFLSFFILITMVKQVDFNIISLK